MIRWRLRQYLDEHDLSAYAVVKTADLASNTVYALARGDQRRLDLEVLNKVMSSLQRLTGKQVTPNDLIEYVPDPEPMDDETKAWLDAGLAELAKLEPYDWGEEGEPEGQPIHFVPGEGLIIEDDGRGNA